MILFLYNIVVYIASFLLIPISWFNKKIKLFLNGRKKTFHKLTTIKKEDKVIWFHCASLGEFEQGRPVIESIKENKSYKSYKIVLSFFSPSGYEIRKNYAFADVVCYLPLDTKFNMRKFIKLVHPDMAIIVKYEFWPNLLNELKIKNINTILISAIFRENQSLFKSYGYFIKKSLFAFNHIFVQNKKSKKLLEKINYKNVTIVGDTRFDRVVEIANENAKINELEKFKLPNTTFTLIAGSTWKKDEDLLVNYINNHAKKNQQFIIAPHNINNSAIDELKNRINKKCILFSQINSNNSNAQVLILNTIGLLSKAYKYGDIAYVGGGFGAGIHNTLEPAAFGLPIIIGPNYKKFNEAVELVNSNCCFVINQQSDFNNNLNMFYLNTQKLLETKKQVLNYVKIKSGATNSIITYLKK